jgi:hypothetical protein
LAKQAGLHDSMSEGQQRFIDFIRPLNIEARYPSYRQSLLKVLTNERCALLIQQTEEFSLWIKTTLSK